MEPTITSLGKVFMTERGAWSVGVAYELLDIVAHEGTGSIYICIEAHDSTGLTEPGVQEPSKWGLLCGHGPEGSAPTYTFSEDGFSLSVENPDGSMGEMVNIRGPQGEQGARGNVGLPGAQGPQGPRGTPGPVRSDNIALKDDEGEYLRIRDIYGVYTSNVHIKGVDRG